MRRLSFTVATLAGLSVSPAMAQFPPPGVYTCSPIEGPVLGTLSLLVAGDYSWQPVSGTSGQGQVASSGTDVEALTGPLADAHWHGSFATQAGATRFTFATDQGVTVCAIPA